MSPAGTLHAALIRGLNQYTKVQEEVQENEMLQVRWYNRTLNELFLKGDEIDRCPLGWSVSATTMEQNSIGDSVFQNGQELEYEI